MKKILLTSIAITLLLITACKDEKKDTDATDPVETAVEKVTETTEKRVEFILESKSDSKATGKVAFVEKDNMVTFNAKLKNLSPGMHAIHIHEKADCSSPDGKSAGGHWNPTFEEHGKWGNTTGYHKGDIGNFEVGEDGIGKISMKTDEWCIGCGDDKKDILGKSIIVHQGQDDFVSQPSGAAGARVSCGGIIQ